VFPAVTADLAAETGTGECLQRQPLSGIRVWLPSAAFMRRIEVWCASVGLPPGAACRPGVRKAPMVAAVTPHLSAGATVSPVKRICMFRFVHLQTNGAETFLMCRSLSLVDRERAIYARFADRIETGLPTRSRGTSARARAVSSAVHWSVRSADCYSVTPVPPPVTPSRLPRKLRLRQV
jgi:hypothetical protein